MGNVIFYDEKFEWGSNKATHTYARYWFDLKHYHKYEMSYLSSSRFQSGLAKEKFSEIRLWIQDNLMGEVIVVYQNIRSSVGGLTVYLYFQYEEDMTAFKLRWEE